MLIGTLVKITVLPLLAIMGLIWIIYTLRNRGQIIFKPAFDWKTVSLLALLAGLVVLNFSIYGINFLEYQALTPSCTRF